MKPDSNPHPPIDDQDRPAEAPAKPPTKQRRASSSTSTQTRRAMSPAAAVEPSADELHEARSNARALIETTTAVVKADTIDDVVRDGPRRRPRRVRLGLRLLLEARPRGAAR